VLDLLDIISKFLIISVLAVLG